MMNKLEEIFYSNTEGQISMRWTHYLNIYESYFSKFVGMEVHILEIGVFNGGSIDMWLEFFGDKCYYYGVDYNPNCKSLEKDRVKIFIGSQEDKSFLSELKTKIPKIDIIIDDGGHRMRQQKLSFDYLFDHVKEGGYYSCEDTHTSYARSFGGGLRKRSTFIEFAKRKIDYLYAWQSAQLKENEITKNCYGIHFYNGIVLFEKKKIESYECANVGIKQIPSFKLEKTPTNIYNWIMSKINRFIFGD